MIVAAETGSGKTHSFLVPLIDKLCNERDDSGNAADSDQGVSPVRKISLVLCPNVTLCDQVVRMANGLCGENGEPLLRATSLCGRQVLMLLVCMYTELCISVLLEGCSCLSLRLCLLNFWNMTLMNKKL